MAIQRIGILHPGEMGISVAVTAQNGGYLVHWASEGRSERTRERAQKFGLRDAGTVAEMCASCSVVVSVCPPHAAEDVALQVMRYGFTGVYLDANAIAPKRARYLSDAMSAAGVAFVDGGIIGGPAWKPGTTRLYLSGARAEEIAACFAAGPLETCIIGTEAGRASALKMCYAAYTKGTTALLGAVLAAAGQLGVRHDLYREWAIDDQHFAEQTERRILQASAKAWRYVGEMEEIAATFRDVGLPGEFHEAAATLYRRLAAFKIARESPPLDEVLTALVP